MRNSLHRLIILPTKCIRQTNRKENFGFVTYSFSKAFGLMSLCFSTYLFESILDRNSIWIEAGCAKAQSQNLAHSKHQIRGHMLRSYQEPQTLNLLFLYKFNPNTSAAFNLCFLLYESSYFQCSLIFSYIFV